VYARDAEKKHVNILLSKKKEEEVNKVKKGRGGPSDAGLKQVDYSVTSCLSYKGL
jgi:hypothetical protein